MKEEDAVRILPDEDFFQFVCKWHCIQCGRHFYDEKAFKAHFDTPANFGGCHRPQSTPRLLISVADDGICYCWHRLLWLRPDFRDTPRRDVRVYWSERISR